MESEATATTYHVGRDAADPLFTTGSPVPLDIQSFFAQIPDVCNMEDLLPLDDQSAGHALQDLQFAGDTGHSTIAGLPQPDHLYPVGLAGGATVGTGVEDQREQNAHACFDDFEWTGTGTGLITGQPATCSVGNRGPLTGTDMAEIPCSWSAPLDFNMQEVNAALIPTAADTGSISQDLEEEILLSSSSPLGLDFDMQEINAALTPAAAVKDILPLDQEVNAGAGLSQSGGGDALTEAAVRRTSKKKKLVWTFKKRKKLVCGSMSEFDLVESMDVLVQSDPSSTDIKPPNDSTDPEIIMDFLWREIKSMQPGKQVNLSVGEQDQICPKAVRSYVTTVEMMSDQKTDHGYWKEIGAKFVNHQYFTSVSGLKLTFQYHENDGTKTNCFMDEYIPLSRCGIDRFMEHLRYRVVYSTKVPGETTTSLLVKSKNKIAALKHRMRGPENLVIKGESPAWQHFIKIYDKHPELEGSKMVYAVCCHCEVVFKAGTDNGTKSLLTHCDRTCPVKNKKQQQPSSSSPDSTGDTSCLSTAADPGSSPLDQDFNAGAGLPQSGSGGGALGETPVRASCKRKKLVCGSSSQMSTLPEHNLLVELLAGLVQSDTSSTDIKPPTGSTDFEIIRFLEREDSSMPPRGKEVNLSLGEQDQMAPEAVRSYVTTVKMMPDQNLHDLSYWKEKQVKLLREDESDGIGSSLCRGLKRTFQFHMDDGSETNWFMHEYVPMDRWGHDLFMKPLRFREVYEEVPEVKIKNKIAAWKKHRMRGPENMVVKGESPAWQHFIKIYDKHPELEGSKVVYAVCCHCEGVLKAGTGNGTKSLLTHCDRTCPVKNKKNQQPRSSSYQENRFGILVGVGVR